jgi:hypothetical protein
MATTKHRDALVSWREVEGIAWMVWFGQMGDPFEVAKTVFAQLASKPAGRRVLFCWGQDNGWAEVTELLLRHGPNNYAAKVWFRDFFYALKILGAKVDMFALDLEYSPYDVWGGGFYNGNGAQAQKYYEDPIIRSRMTPEMLALDPKIFSRSDWWNRVDSTVAIGHWGEEMKYADIYETCFAPYVACFNNRVTNYGTQQCRFPVIDLNGWRIVPNSQTKICSPVVYIWNGQAQNARAKHPCWNSIIDALNMLRAAQTGVPVYPWFARPSFTGDNPIFTDLGKARAANTVLLEHSFRLDWTTGILWNAATGPGGTVTQDDKDDDKLTLELLARLGELNYSPSPLDRVAIPADANLITTAGYTTTYEEFLRMIS